MAKELCAAIGPNVYSKSGTDANGTDLFLHSMDYSSKDLLVMLLSFRNIFEPVWESACGRQGGAAALIGRYFEIL